MIVTLVGPITYWWGNWDTDEHREFVAHRELVGSLVEKMGHLVYRPDDAFKGSWVGHEKAHQVNEFAIRVSDLVINLIPDDDVVWADMDEVLSTCCNAGVSVLWLPPFAHGDKPLSLILEENGL